MKFPELVIEEATNLKRLATKEELANLDFDQLNPQDARYCIYGQMTGSCWSARTKELIPLCCERVYECDKENNPELTVEGACVLNGSPIGKSRHEYWSPIEVFIAQENKEANQMLILFLKGEIDSLS